MNIRPLASPLLPSVSTQVAPLQPPVDSVDLQGAARTLLAPRAGLADPAWTLDLPGNALPPAVAGAGSRIYLRSEDHCLYAVDGTTGQVAWKHASEEALSLPVHHPAGLLLVGSAKGELLALDEGTGEARWTLSIGTDRVDELNRGKEYSERIPYHVQPAVGPDGAIYVGSDRGSVYVLNLEGKPVRELPITRDRLLRGPKKLDLPVFPSFGAGGRLVVTTSDHEIQVLDPASGRRLWATKCEDALEPVPGPQGSLLVREGLDRLHSFDEATGAERWTHSAGFQSVLDVRVGSDGRIYTEGCTSRSFVRALDPATGRELWTDDEHAGLVAERSDGTLWVGQIFGHEISRVDPGTGQRIGDPVDLEGRGAWTNLDPAPGGYLLAQNQHGRQVSAFAPGRPAPPSPPPADGSRSIEGNEETVLIGGVRLPVRRG